LTHFERVPDDLGQVGFGTTSEADPSHDLPAVAREFKSFPEPGKWIAFSDSARFAFGDGRPKRVQFCFVFFFVPLERSKGGADDLARVFVTAGFDFGSYEPIQLIRQVDVAGWQWALI
jgi:hypothetical protein